MKRFLTSDNHFGHEKVIVYCNRPFASVEEMNERLIQNWNEVVNPNDVVYNLGDFSFHERYVEQYLPRLNGVKHLILGNHDKPHPANKGKTPEKYADWVAKYIALGFASVNVAVELDGFLLCHLPYNDPDDFHQLMPGQEHMTPTLRYPKHRPVDNGLPQLCGHVHDKWLSKKTSSGTLMLNVGVDAPGAPWSMRPATWEEVMAVYEQEKNK